MLSSLIFAVRASASFFMIATGLLMLLLSAVKLEPVVLCIAILFTVAGFFAIPRRPNAWRRDPPTQNQVAYAQKLGIDIPHGVTKGELSEMISSVTGR